MQTENKKRIGIFISLLSMFLFLNINTVNGFEYTQIINFTTNETTFGGHANSGSGSSYYPLELRVNHDYLYSNVIYQIIENVNNNVNFYTRINDGAWSTIEKALLNIYDFDCSSGSGAFDLCVANKSSYQKIGEVYLIEVKTAGNCNIGTGKCFKLWINLKPEIMTRTGVYYYAVLAEADNIDITFQPIEGGAPCCVNNANYPINLLTYNGQSPDGGSYGGQTEYYNQQIINGGIRLTYFINNITDTTGRINYLKAGLSRSVTSSLYDNGALTPITHAEDNVNTYTGSILRIEGINLTIQKDNSVLPLTWVDKQGLHIERAFMIDPCGHPVYYPNFTEECFENWKKLYPISATETITIRLPVVEDTFISEEYPTQNFYSYPHSYFGEYTAPKLLKLGNNWSNTLLNFSSVAFIDFDLTRDKIEYVDEAILTVDLIEVSNYNNLNGTKDRIEGIKEIIGSIYPYPINLKKITYNNTGSYGFGEPLAFINRINPPYFNISNRRTMDINITNQVKAMLRYPNIYNGIIRLYARDIYYNFSSSTWHDNHGSYKIGSKDGSQMGFDINSPYLTLKLMRIENKSINDKNIFVYGKVFDIINASGNTDLLNYAISNLKICIQFDCVLTNEVGLFSFILQKNTEYIINIERQQINNITYIGRAINIITTNNTEMDLGYIPAFQSIASLAGLGSVYGWIFGIADEGERYPIVNAKICMSNVTNSSIVFERCIDADNNGYYVFGNISKGLKLFEVMADGYNTINYNFTVTVNHLYNFYMKKGISISSDESLIKFKIRANGNSIENIKITIGRISKNTDKNGEASFIVTRGLKYYYTIEGSGYENKEGEFIADNQLMYIQIDLLQKSTGTPIKQRAFALLRLAGIGDLGIGIFIIAICIMFAHAIQTDERTKEPALYIFGAVIGLVIAFVAGFIPVGIVLFIILIIAVLLAYKGKRMFENTGDEGE